MAEVDLEELGQALERDNAFERAQSLFKLSNAVNQGFVVTYSFHFSLLTSPW
jgi:hypothetical protein